MPVHPYLFLDVDGVLHGTSSKYGYDQMSVVEERIDTHLVHPALRPRKLGGGDKPDWLLARRAPARVSFRTRVRTSPRRRAAIADMPVDVKMLTTWLEHDSVDEFFAQTPGPSFPYDKLTFPGRDDTGDLPPRWKLDALTRVLDEDPRPFIWTDDDEVPVWRDELEQRYPHIPKLLIAPIYDIALTPEHIRQMTEFAAAHTR